jgi:ubiquinone/menaquinone biosynthesis C-methylase UbiE
VQKAALPLVKIKHKRKMMNMKQMTNDLFVKPGTNEILKYFERNRKEWYQDENETIYPIEKGIIRFLVGAELTGNNKNFQKLYDRASGFYGILTQFAVLKNGNEENRLMQYLSDLDIKEKDKVIEISIGNGRNIKYLNQKATYFGVDISLGMLQKCMKNMSKRNHPIVLIQAEAENLPLKDESFDVVFSAGGFNYFNDRDKAIKEMLRIAKPRTRLMISDETEKIMDSFEKMPLFGKMFKQNSSKKPYEFVPKYCKDVQYREICNGELYVLTFVKP